MAKMLTTLALLAAVILAMQADAASLRKAVSTPKSLLKDAKARARKNPMAKHQRAHAALRTMRAQQSSSSFNSWSGSSCRVLQRWADSYWSSSSCRLMRELAASNTHQSWHHTCDTWCGYNLNQIYTANATCFEADSYANLRRAKSECDTCGGYIDALNEKSDTATCKTAIADLSFGLLDNSTAADRAARAAENPNARANTFCGSTCRQDMTTAANRTSPCWATPANASKYGQYGNGYFNGGFNELVELCEGPSKCYSEALGSLVQEFDAQCQTGERDPFDALFDLGNRSTASTSAVTKFCDAGCVSKVQDYSTNYQECIEDDDDSFANMLSSLNVMCTKHNNEYCSIVLRSLADADCDQHDQHHQHEGEQGCGATSTSFCVWDKEDRECYSNASSAQLDTVCTPCLDKYVLLLRDASAKAEALFFQRLYCSKEDDKFCYPIVNQYYDDDVLDFDLTNVTKADAEKMTSNLCAVRTNRKCLTRMTQLLGTQVAASVAASYAYCAQSMSTVWQVERYCLPQFHHGMANVNAFTRMLSFMCSKNDNSTYCVPMMREVTNHTCANGLFRGNCTADCGTWMSGLVDRLGCCMSRINTVFDERENEAYPRSITPAVKLWNGTRVRVTEKPSTYKAPTSFNETAFAKDHAMNFAQACTALNNSDFRTKATTACKGRTGTAPKRDLKLKGLLWSKVQADPIFKARLEASLRTDCAAAMGVPEADIVNGTLIEDKTQELRETATSSRRQTTAAAGTSYEFSVDGADDDEAAAAAEDFDALVSSGKLTVPSAATVIEEDCTNCVAQSVSDPTLAPGETANPNIFASLTGAESSVDAVSTSASVATAAAALVAAAALAL